MTPLLADRIVVRASRERLWELLRSPDQLARVLPGCEELREIAPDMFEGTFRTKVQFLTLRARSTVRLLDLEPPERLRLEVDGRPLGLAGAFVVSIPLELAEDGGGTLVGYAMSLNVSGRLATFGAPLLRETARRQVQELVRNLERELGGERAE